MKRIKMKKHEMKPETCLIEAINKIEDYIEQTTGQRPTHREIADALSHFFVLKEIGEFIEMSRQQDPTRKESDT